MKKLYKSIVLKIIVALVVIYTLLGFVILPYFIQANFSKTLKTFTSANGYLERVYINPYTFEVELTNLLIQDDKNKTLLFFNKFGLDFEFKSIFTDVFVIQSIYMKDLKTNTILDRQKVTNFQYILDFLNKDKTAKAEETEKISTPVIVKIKDIKLIDSRIVFIDNSKSSPFEIKTKKFDINVQNLSLVPNSKGKLIVITDITNTAVVKINSSLSLNPVKLEGSFSLDNLRVDKIYTYIKDDVDFDLSGERIDLYFRYKIAVKDDNLKISINDIDIFTKNIKYKQKDINIDLGMLRNRVEQINIEKDIDLLDIKLNGKLSMQDIKINRPYQDINGTKDFLLNINKLDTNLAYDVNFKNDNLKVIIDDTNILLNDVNYENKDLKANVTTLTNNIKQININKQKEDKDIDLLAKNVKIKDASFIFNDLTKKTPIQLKIKNINAKVDALTLDKTVPIVFNLSLDDPKKGTITTKGMVVVEPLNLDLNIKTKDMTLVPYLPYLKEFVNIDLKSGLLNNNINVKLKKGKKEFLPNITADISLDKIDIFHSLTNQRVASFKQLKVDKLTFKPNNLNIKKVTLNTAYSKIAIAEDSTTNLDNLIPSKDVKEKEEQTTTSDFKYFIKEFELKNSKTNFSDFSLPLYFATKIHSLKANIKDISSNDAHTKLKLNGIVDEYGMATIVGDINLVNFKKRTDVKVDFENLDITSFSPYSTKFIGNKIDKGKLWLDLNYQIRNSKLNSTNNMRIKNLTLGEKIESKDAVDLPIGLFIALLEDSDGFIEVDVPVKGDIDNPDFQLGGAIWSAVGNIITNIVTAPFRFLGSLFGIDSDELGSIDFDYGVATIIPTQKEKLDTLAKALNKKPNLSLKVNPVYDEKNDLLVFQKEMLMSLIDKKDKEVSIKELFIKEFGEEEYEKIKASNKDKDVILSEILIDKLVPTIAVEKGILENLALRRADKIKEYLLAKKLDSARVIVSNEIKTLITEDTNRVTINLDVDIKK